ncbi:60Kd inner membrane family protein [Candidatus Endolissoclinum faulkneri L2]|uniref:Membrane protein insertase YidC n=1 Tax=Candidatus Endolissoclinum faulkneri L2 TaxID=1193729 RepID=K7YH23_9PROT|nr:membrane protein insertase YidC [Candidatus Endolissoclinum faulkneri]AFX98855.1 60Kd inner membrane family protein [Candidatus Endolissoclinum faulkneri L2]
MNDQKRIMIAIALSLAILFGFQLLVAHFWPSAITPQQQSIKDSLGNASDYKAESINPSFGQAVNSFDNRAVALATTKRIKINTPTIKGSISLIGARIDDIVLDDYHVTLDPASGPIHLLEPTNYVRPYYAEFGWVSKTINDIDLPNSKTKWESSAAELTPNSSVTLTWKSQHCLTFKRTIEVDDNYMFNITDSVSNEGNITRELFPYALISRSSLPKNTGFYILHEGPLGVFDDTLMEIDYNDLHEQDDKEVHSKSGWIGFTDKYWLVALISDQSTELNYKFRHSIINHNERFQVDYMGTAKRLRIGDKITNKLHLFAGAKRLDLLDKYEEQIGVPKFDLAIDFGWFYFLTKPFFILLTWFHSILGNFGLAILALTVCIKLLFFPLANKSYRSMAKLKELAPRIQEMRKKHGANLQLINKDIMEMYKLEKVNPAAGCLPIIVQIPVFFSLYKVLFVNIEMRHAPFFGWIHDLSAPDPTTIFNIFGLLPWSPPSILMIGVWPLLMGVTMFLQQQMNPRPNDPVQAKIFMFLPLIFTFLLSNFAAGLVIYWTWNNLLSIIQQRVIMRRISV